MANNPYVNKVVYGGQTLIDISDTTATADKILEGYTAYGADGSRLVGTAVAGSVTQDQDGFIVLPPSGGSSQRGGGLEYEEGTWTPSADIAKPTISFTNTHTVPPMFVLMTDATGTYDGTLNSNAAFSFVDWYRYGGSGVFADATTQNYGLIYARYRASSASSYTNTSLIALTSSDDTDESSTYTSRRWIKPDCFMPSSNSDSRYWRAGRTYKWIAVWAPTT